MVVFVIAHGSMMFHAFSGYLFSYGFEARNHNYIYEDYLQVPGTPKLLKLKSRLCENYRLSAFGAKNHRLKQKPSTLVIKPNGGERLKTVYTSISQHPKTIQNPTISGAQSIGWTRIRAPHTEKYGTFSPFFHIFFIFSVLTKINGQPTSGPKAQRNSGKMAHNTQSGFV